jgi:GR25 family glycosyltransferase involved in LPS biosynthesis
MKTVCITVADDSYGERGPLQTRQHFAERGIEAQFFHGLHASRLGVTTRKPYTIDRPDNDWCMGEMPTGCWLSHRALWAMLACWPDEHVLVLEDDAELPADWRARFDVALRDTPGDFDVLLIGSCCTQGKPKTFVQGDVWDVRYPLCTHAMVLARKALPVLMKTQDEVGTYAPVDISLMLHSYPKLKVYTVLPRLVGQHNTGIPE